MNWEQVGAFAGVVVAIGVAQMAYVKNYVDKVVAEVRTEVATQGGNLATSIADLRGDVRVLDRDVQAIASKAHDHP